MTRANVTFLDLEFDTGESGGAPLGDIASSLVSLHDLLRDLATMAAYPSSAEFRDIQVVAIEMRAPLTIKLSLFAIPDEAVKAFQDICRDIILCRERDPQQDASPADAIGLDAARRIKINSTVALLLGGAGHTAEVTDDDARHLYRHVATLQHAQLPLKRVVARESG